MKMTRNGRGDRTIDMAAVKKNEGASMKETIKTASGELSLEMFLEALMTYKAIQVEAAKQLFEKEPVERTPEAYKQLLNDLTEEFTGEINSEAPVILPGLRGLNDSFQEMLEYNLKRKN